MKTAFLTSNRELCAQYSISLSKACIENWIVPNFNALHQLFKQELIDIVFVDYQMIDHKHFNVLSHIKSHRHDLLLFYFNQSGINSNSIYESWQDQLSQFFPEHNTTEIQDLLKIAAYKDFSNRSTPIFYNTTLPVYELNTEKKENTFPLHFLDKSYPHTICKSAAALLELLYQNRNKAVSLLQMEAFLWQEHSDSHIKTIYTYIHSLRDLLNDSHKSPKKVVRVRKGYYSLLVTE